MREQNGKIKKSTYKKVALRIVLPVFVVLVVAVRGVGYWLIDEDLSSKVDVIVVLSGGMSYRPAEAGRIFGLGYAPEAWVTRPDIAEAVSGNSAGQDLTEEEYTRRTLISGGVPPGSVRVLPGSVVNTEEELVEVAQEMRRTGKLRVMIVTSPQHTRRVRVLWNMLAKGDLTAVVHAAHDDPFDARYWWRHSYDALSVVHEILGILNAWLGLPARPRSYLLIAARKAR